MLKLVFSQPCFLKDSWLDVQLVCTFFIFIFLFFSVLLHFFLPLCLGFKKFDSSLILCLYNILPPWRPRGFYLYLCNIIVLLGYVSAFIFLNFLRYRMNIFRVQVSLLFLKSFLGLWFQILTPCSCFNFFFTDSANMYVTIFLLFSTSLLSIFPFFLTSFSFPQLFIFLMFFNLPSSSFLQLFIARYLQDIIYYLFIIIIYSTFVRYWSFFSPVSFLI